MSSQRYANNLSVPRFAKSPPLSFAETSPSMYSQASLPRDSWNSFKFPTNDNVRHKPLQRQSSNRTSRAPSIELSDSSSDRRDVAARYHSQTTHSQSHALPRLEVSSSGNNAISSPRRLSRSSSATGPRPRRSESARHQERPSQSNHARTLAVPHEDPRIVSVCSTVGSVIKYYSNPPTPVDTHRSTRLHREAPTIIWKQVPSIPDSRPGVGQRINGANPARSLSTCSTSTYVDSDLTAPTLIRVPYPTAAPDSLRNKIQSGIVRQDNHDRALRTVQYSPYDFIIAEVPNSESEMDEVPRWRRREVKGPGLIDRFFGRKRASSLTSHRRRLGFNATGEPTSLNYASSFSASVKSLPARFHSAVSLSTFAGSSTLKSRKSLKSRLLSIFSPSTVNIETQSLHSEPTSARTATFSHSDHTVQTPTSPSFSLSKFSLLARRKRSNSTEELRSYIRENHPGIRGKAAGSSRTVSPRRAESLTGWVSSDFEIDPMEARMTARSFGISDGTRPMPHGY